jgi:coenzyme F420-reducing hydrogenase delta subunit
MTQDREAAVATATTQAGQGETFEPEITALTCIYCGFMSADTAGALHFSYPANVKLLKLPCTGKVDVEYILKAFENGADGVYVIACPLGNCHHLEGNVRATKRVAYAKKLLDEIGLGGERVEIFYMSGGQGGAFAEAARTMTERIRKLGPNPLRRRTEGC